MSVSRFLRNHRAKHGLWADRCYIVFERTYVQSDLALFLDMFINEISAPDLKALAQRLSAQMKEEVFDEKKLDSIREEIRQAAWRHRHLPSENHSAMLLQFSVAIAGGNLIEPVKKGQELTQ